MASLRLSPRARQDLGDIWGYTADRWGAAQAETYLRTLQSAMEALAAEPGRGQICDDIRTGYRKHPAGAHIVFYRISEDQDGVDVVRILHQRMDVDGHL